MSLRARILLLSAVVVVAVSALAAMVVATIRGTDFYVRRVALAHQQLAAMTELAESANAYSEQVTTVLLLGDQEMPDLIGARREVEARFTRLQDVTREEIAFLQARLPGHRAVPAGTTLSLALPSTLHLFDADTGRRLPEVRAQAVATA